MKRPYLELVKEIRDAIRTRAQSYGETNGAIRILAYPLCKTADDWFGGLSNFEPKHGLEPNDIADYEHTFALTAGNSRVVSYTEDNVEQKVDCYAFSALKIAHCSRVQDAGAGLLSGIKLKEAYLTEKNGYGPYFGALCVEIEQYFFTKNNGRREIQPLPRDFCNLYVCVSGTASSWHDLSYAFLAINVIRDFFENEGTYKYVFKPTAPSWPSQLSEQI